MPPPRCYDPAQKTKFKRGMQYYVDTYGLRLGTVENYREKNYPLDDPRALLARILQAPQGRKPDLDGLRAHIASLAAPEPSAPAGPPRRPRLPGTVSKIHLDGKPPAAGVPFIAQNGHTLPRAELDRIKKRHEDREEDPADGEEDEEEGLEDLNPAALGVVGATLKGLQREIAQLDRECGDAYRRFKAAKDPVVKLSYQKLWAGLQEQWRKLAKDAPAAEKEAGTLLKASDVESVWRRTFKDMSVELDYLSARIALNPLFRDLDTVDVEEVVTEEVKVIREKLRGGDVLAPKGEDSDE